MTPNAYPFTAVVGQDQMKLALVLNAINPRLGGVLIRGEKGTAKSTAARGIAALLPRLQVVAGCRFACDPAPGAPRCPDCAAREAAGEPLPATGRPAALVELPIGATEDRVLGTLDLERALQLGQRHFDPGLLASANRGLLYVDEVNLLPDHLVDALLDAAASGVNSVEREGLSFSHPAAFVLVGTMNPEEGELRPQLLDRFGLAVDVAGMPQPAERAEVVRRRIAFEHDPVAFAGRWLAAEQLERGRIEAARERLARVAVSDDLLNLIASICTAFEVDGLRADIVIYKTASTLAAYAGRQHVTAEDVRTAAELALPHRRRRQPFDQPGLDPTQLDQLIQQHTANHQPPVPPDPTRSPDSTPGEDHTSKTHPDNGPPETWPDGPGAAPPDQVFEVGAVPPLTSPPAQTDARPAPARTTPISPPAHDRTARIIESATGRHVRSAPPSKKLALHTLDVAATLVAAAPYQLTRAPSPAGRLRLELSDVRIKLRQERATACTLFVLDASGSMAAKRRMAAAKGAVVSLLTTAYQHRTQVGLIAFRGLTAELILAPTRGTDLAYARLKDLPTGGRTPLAVALTLAQRTLSRWLTGRRESEKGALARLVLVSDCRANVTVDGADPHAAALAAAHAMRSVGVSALVVDTEEGPVRLGLARQFAEALGAPYLRLSSLGQKGA